MSSKQELINAIASVPDEDLGKSFVKLFIRMPGGEIETISNPKIREKAIYIEKAYDDYLCLKTFPAIHIEDYEVHIDYRDGKHRNFGEVIEALKAGDKARRRGWNGKGMFLYYVPEGAYPVRMECIKGMFKNDMVPYGAYIAMKTAQDNVVPWLASQTDMLAEDWEIVE